MLTVRVSYWSMMCFPPGGGVEYPIRADYIGWSIKSEANRKILVEFSEEEGADGVYEVAWQRRTE